MNDRLVDMLFLALLVLISSIFISWSFVVEPRWNLPGDGSRPGVSIIDSTLESMGNFFSPADVPAADMSTELTNRLRGKVTMHIDSHDVANQAAALSADPGERSRTLDRLKGAMGAFQHSLATAEWHITRAREDKSRSAAEISEAEEALGEMQRGAGFISRRMDQASESAVR
jgi:hypothetical protein